jgi:predicted GNAT superfamily acetyltransferase
MILVRHCEGFDELEACVRLQVDTWRMDADETTPRKTFLLAQKIGGQVMAAFDTALPGTSAKGEPKSLVGFAMALPGVRTGKDAPQPYLHSHMLAVRPEYRNRGLGARLKQAQRLDALDRGIRLMEWTFDPLEIKNAYLNIHKLGAIVCRYLENFYGTSSSLLQGGLPTDRLVAEWRLDASRVQSALAGRPLVPHKEEIQARIQVPAAIYAWKASATERERALAVLLENRQKFQTAFSQGLAVVGFVRDEQGNGIFELALPAPSEAASNSKEEKK